MPKTLFEIFILDVQVRYFVHISICQHLVDCWFYIDEMIGDMPITETFKGVLPMVL